MTVRSNYNGFSRKQIDNAATARRLLGMVASPSNRDFEGLVRYNMIKDCPITITDVKNAHKIYSPDLAAIRGKTIQRKPTRVITDYVDIPKEIIDVNQRVTLAADIMFVNSVPFLVSVSRNINLITIEHAPQRTASKLGILLHCIARVYARAGFTVQTILMDNDFKKVRDHVPMLALNTPAANKNIGDIKRRIRVVKERSRGIICTLPYAKIPQIILIHLINFVVMWLNNFPTRDGISMDYSPRELIFRHRLSYKRHCHS